MDANAVRRRGFTLIELLVVMLIIMLVSVVALPSVVSTWSNRQVSEAGRLLQAALAGARDKAIRDGQPSGIRLIPDPAWPLGWDASGRILPSQALAYGRIIPLDPAPDYSEGMVTIRPGMAYPTPVPALVLEGTPTDGRGTPNPPTSWAWNVRVGDKVQVRGAGPWYTIVGPMATGPAQGNAEMFVNWGPSGTASPLGIEYLMLVNGHDDNGNGWVDEGFDGVDNNGNGLIDEHQPGVFDTIGGIRIERDEWQEIEQWLGIPTAGVTSVPYVIRRRPIPSPSARDIALPTQMVVDAGRSRLPVDASTGVVDILVNPDGTAAPSLSYGVPASLGMTSAFMHFALVERGDVRPMNAVPMPPPAGQWSVLTLATRTGNIVALENPDPANPFAAAQQGAH